MTRPLTALAGLAAIMILPYIGRPLFVDDHAHYAEALAWTTHSDLYQNESAAMGWKRGDSPGEANPPLYFFVMSHASRLWGADLWKAHLVMFVFTLGSLLAFYRLAQRYTTYPLWASALWISSPDVWLSANSLLLDAMLPAFFLVGLVCWIEGWERRKTLWLALGALAMGLAPFVKYTGLLVWLVAALWVIFEARDKKSFQWIWMVIPAAMFASWIGWSHHVYGESHFSAVARNKLSAPSVSHSLALLVFAIGTTPLIALAGWWRLFKGPWPVGMIRLLLAAVLFIVGMKTEQNIVIGAMIGFWLASVVLAVSAIPKDPRARFLSAWALAGLLMIGLAIQWVCGRYFLVVGPALTLLAVVALEAMAPSAIQDLRVRAVILVGLGLFSWGIVHADYRQALADGSAAQDAESWRKQQTPPPDGYFPGATLSAVGYDLGELGWKPLSPGAKAPSGALILLPLRTLPKIFWPSVADSDVVAEFSYPSRDPFRTLDGITGAGYYGSIWGPLPFSFSRGPLDRYVLIRRQSLFSASK